MINACVAITVLKTNKNLIATQFINNAITRSVTGSTVHDLEPCLHLEF